MMTERDLFLTLAFFFILILFAIPLIIYGFKRKRSVRNFDALKQWIDLNRHTLPPSYKNRFDELLTRIELLFNQYAVDKDAEKFNEMIAIKETLHALIKSSSDRITFNETHDIEALVKKGKENKALKRQKVVNDLINNHDVFLYGKVADQAYLVEDFYGNFDVLLEKEKRFVRRNKEGKIIAFSRGFTNDRILLIWPFKAYYIEKERYVVMYGKTIDDRYMFRDKAGSTQLAPISGIDISKSPDFSAEQQEKIKQLKHDYDQALISDKEYLKTYRDIIVA